MKQKSGQIELTFNWIYILVAGAVILLFFVGITLQQKTASEERLSIDILQKLDSIFTGAEVSESTKNFIDTSGLSDYTLYFSCEDGVGRYGIEGYPAESEIQLTPLFAPSSIKTSQIITWSLPYQFPFKAADFLFVTSSNTQYFLLGANPFKEEFLKAAEGLNLEEIDSSSYEKIKAGQNYQVRIIDLDGTITDNSNVPASLSEMDDDKVTAVSFTSASIISYFQKQGTQWRLVKEGIPLLSLGGERDAAKYAAIFSADGDTYLCNMQKVFTRLNYLNLIYEKKIEGLIEYYKNTYQYSIESKTANDCLGLLRDNLPDNLISVFKDYKKSVENCYSAADLPFCNPSIIYSANQLQAINELLYGNCLSLY